jgi:hypothetical protein
MYDVDDWRVEVPGFLLSIVVGWTYQTTFTCLQLRHGLSMSLHFLVSCPFRVRLYSVRRVALLSAGHPYGKGQDRRGPKGSQMRGGKGKLQFCNFA